MAAAAPARVRFPQLALLERPPALPSEVVDRLGPLGRIGPLRHAAILEELLAALDSPDRAIEAKARLFADGPKLEVAGVRVNAENFRRLVEARDALGGDLVNRSKAVVKACRRMRTAAREACIYRTAEDTKERYKKEKEYREENKIKPDINVRKIKTLNTIQTECSTSSTKIATWVHGTLAGVPVVTGARIGSFECTDDYKKPNNGISVSAWANVATSDVVLKTCIRVAAGTPDEVRERLLVKRGESAMGEFKETGARVDPKNMANEWKDLDEDELDGIPVAVVMQILLTSCSRGQNKLMHHERKDDVPTWPNRLKLYPAVDRWAFFRTLPVGGNTKPADYERPGVIVLTERVELKVGKTRIQVARFANAAALALLRLHGQCFCHNNIVPWSFACAGEDVVLCDLAFIRPFTAGPAPRDPPSFEDELRIPVPGAHDYCAPESLRGVFDTRSDVYMLGRTLYAITTGLAPVAGGDLNYDALGARLGMDNGLAVWISASQSEYPEGRPTLADLVLAIRENPTDVRVFEEFERTIAPVRDGGNAPSPGDRNVLWERSHLRHSLGAVFNRDVEVYKDGTVVKGRKKAVEKAGSDSGKEEKKNKKNKRAEQGAEEKAEPAKKKKAAEKKEKVGAKEKRAEEEKKDEPAKRKKRNGDEEKKQDAPPQKRVVVNLVGDDVPAAQPMEVNLVNQGDLDWEFRDNGYQDFDQALLPVLEDAPVDVVDYEQFVIADAAAQARLSVQPGPDVAQLRAPVPAPAPQDLLPPHPPQHPEPNPAPAQALAPEPRPLGKTKEFLENIRRTEEILEAAGFYNKPSQESESGSESESESDEDQEPPPSSAVAPQSPQAQPAPRSMQAPPSPTGLGEELNPMGSAQI